MAYLPALKNGFVWDDTYFITDLPYLRDPALWWRYIWQPLFVSTNYFRPLPLLSFVLEARIEPLTPFVFHLSNLLLHAANTTLIVSLARKAAAANGSTGHLGPLVAGLFFAVHPALIETVSWVSDRFDLMMALFLLLALLCETSLKKTTTRDFATGLFYFLALLCKETAIVFFALLPLWQLSSSRFEKSSWRNTIRCLIRNAWSTWVALVLATVIYLALRYQSLDGFYRNDSLTIPGNVLQHMLLSAKTLAWYFVLLCWPFGQIGPVHPSSTPIPLTDVLAWFSVAVVIAAIGGIALLLRRRPRTGLLACAALISLTPVANLMPLTIGDNIAHDRYLLLPLAFVSLGLVTFPAIRFRLASTIGTAIWVGLSLATILLTVPRWESNLSLWNWAYALEPQSNIARGNLVAALVNTGHNQTAIDISREILQASPDNAMALYNTGLSLMRLGRNEEARRYCEMALRQLQDASGKEYLDAAEVLNLLGYLSMESGDLDEAEKSLRKSIRLSPYLTRPHFNLAMLHYQRKHVDAGDVEMAFVLHYDSPEMADYHRRQANKKRAELQLTDLPVNLGFQPVPQAE
jgi:tetratricopeptide (TPR) repeat protein